MTSLSPADSFRLRQPTAAAELQLQADSDWLRISMDYALAELADQLCGADELNGAKRFKGILLNMATKPVAPTRLPDRSRLPSIDGPEYTAEESK